MWQLLFVAFFFIWPIVMDTKTPWQTCFVEIFNPPGLVGQTKCAYIFNPNLSSKRLGRSNVLFRSINQNLLKAYLHYYLFGWVCCLFYLETKFICSVVFVPKRSNAFDILLTPSESRKSAEKKCLLRETKSTFFL